MSRAGEAKATTEITEITEERNKSRIFSGFRRRYWDRKPNQEKE
jgi:hypothetical protein